MKYQVFGVMVALFLGFAAPMVAASEPEIDRDAIQAARLDYLSGAYGEALSILRPAAEAGDAMAQNVLGTAYEQGNGVPVDMEQALGWYEKSATQGYAKAEHNLALFLIGRADGLIRDQARAAQLFKRAMAQGFGPSFWERGRMYRDGALGPADTDAARAIFELGHALGNGQSGNALAELYRLGNGVPQDGAKAREIYRQTGENGYGVAVGNLALMYEQGIGGPVDLPRAHDLFVRAVRMGDANAAVNLASFMLNHSGDWQSRPRAWAYCLWGVNAARRDQYEKLRYYCSQIGKALSEDERAQGEEILQNGL